MIDFVRRWVPANVRYAIQRVVPLTTLKEQYFERRNPLANVITGDDNSYGSPATVGILRNRSQYHTHYVAACCEMGVPFRVIDIAASDWINVVKESKCGLFFAWPDASLTTWAGMFKDRCDVLEKELGYTVVPTSGERWMYEDKYRMRDWLHAHSIPHPQTWVFYYREEAEAFADTCDLPVVFKTPFGAAASGVRIIRTRKALKSVIRRAFTRGHVPSGHDRRDRQWGSILLQEYLYDVREWRMVRIGDSYFGHPKGRVGEFHSGSGRAEWDVPQKQHLDLLHRVTEAGSFRSMDVDVFELPDGRLVVNELQAVFGASVSVDQLRVNGVPGRMVRNTNGEWFFEAGDFARNACANERIRDALARWSS